MSVRLKANQILEKANYLPADINYAKLKKWVEKKIPKAVTAFSSLGWNLAKADTWEEMVFITATTRIYEQNIAFYFTTTLTDYHNAKLFIATKKAKELRQVLGIQCHSNILLPPSQNFGAKDIDLFWLDYDRLLGYHSVDFCNYGKYTDI